MSAVLRMGPLLLLLMGTLQSGSRVRPSRIFVLENVSTKAGALKLVKIVDYDIGETNWMVVLRGKGLYRTQDDVFGSVTFHTIFKGNQDDEVILMQETFNPDSCGQFRIIDIPAHGKATVSGRFGYCDPLITQDGKRIIFTFPVRPDVKSSTWVYQNHLLTEQK